MRSSPPGAPPASARRRGVRRAPRPRRPHRGGGRAARARASTRRARDPGGRQPDARPHQQSGRLGRRQEPRAPPLSHVLVGRVPALPSSPATAPSRVAATASSSPRRFLSAVARRRHRRAARPPADNWAYRDLAKFSLALAWRLHSALSVGLSYAHLWSSATPLVGAASTPSISRWRCASAAASRGAGGARRARPTVDLGLPLQRVYEPEIAVRPLGNSRLELSVGARFGERRGDVDPRFRLWVPPASRRVAQDRRRVAPRLESRRQARERRARRDRPAARSRARRRLRLRPVRQRPDATRHGSTVAARISGERYPAFWPGALPGEDRADRRDRAAASCSTALVRLRTRSRSDRPARAWWWWSASSTPLRRRRGDPRRDAAPAPPRRSTCYAFARQLDPKELLHRLRRRAHPPRSGGRRSPSRHRRSTALYFKGTGELLGVQADFVRIARTRARPSATPGRRRHRRPGSSAKTRSTTFRPPRQRHRRRAARSRPTAELVDRSRRPSPRPTQRRGIIDELSRRTRSRARYRERLAATSPIGDASRAPSAGQLRPAEDRSPDGRRRPHRRQIADHPDPELKMVGLKTLLAGLIEARGQTPTSRPSSCASTAPAARRWPPISSRASWSAPAPSSRWCAARRPRGLGRLLHRRALPRSSPRRRR